MPKFIVEMTQEQYDAIVRRSEEVYGYDAHNDFNPYKFSGGNFDDCYEMGLEHADADAAREVLSILGKPVED